MSEPLDESKLTDEERAALAYLRHLFAREQRDAFIEMFTPKVDGVMEQVEASARQVALAIETGWLSSDGMQRIVEAIELGRAGKQLEAA